MNIEEMIQGNPQALVTNYNGVLVADSLEVADRFGKRHTHVLRSIDDLVAQLSIQSTQNWADYFIPDNYLDKRNREQKRYRLTRDGFSLLVMGFTGPAALHWKLQYIEAFNKMEEKIKTQPDITAMITQITAQVIQTLLPEIRKAVEPPQPPNPQLPEKKPVSLEDLPPILTVYDIRDYLQIGQRQAYELAHNEDFPAMKIGNRLLIQKSDFAEWLQRRKGYV